MKTIYRACIDFRTSWVYLNEQQTAVFDTQRDAAEDDGNGYGGRKLFKDADGSLYTHYYRRRANVFIDEPMEYNLGGE